MRRNQSVTIAALIIAIVGLSIGFAAFSNTLTIRSSATVNPDSSSLRVVFSLDDDSEVSGGTGGVTPNSNTYGDPGTIDNTTQGNSKIEGLHAKFTAPGQSVKYNTNLYVYNAGSLQAQLTGVTFNNAQGVNTYKKCTAVTENKQAAEIATDSLVQAACADITISVKVGTKTATPADPSLNYQILGVGESLPAEITITYGGNVYVDGDFEVSFGDVVINATSAVDSSLVVTPVENTTVELSIDDLRQGGGTDALVLPLDDIWTSEEIQQLKNNMTLFSGEAFEGIETSYYFNEISCSDNTLTNKSDANYRSLDSQDNYYWIQYTELNETPYLLFLISKNGLHHDDLDNSAFDSLTFTITGRNSD